MKRYSLRMTRIILLIGLLMVVSVTSSQAQSITYVTNALDDSLAVIYTATHEIKNPPVRAIIPLRPEGSSESLNPVDTIVTPYNVRGNATGQFVYTINKNANSVSVVDAVKSKLINTIYLGAGTVPVAAKMSGVRLNPVGGQCRQNNPLWRTFLYVVDSATNSLSIIDTDPQSLTWNTVVKTIPVGHNPTAVAVSKPTLEEYALSGNGSILEPDFSSGFYVMVTNSADNTVTVIGADYRSGAERYGAGNYLVGCGDPNNPDDEPASPDFHEVITTLNLNDPALSPPNSGVNPSAISFERYGRWAYVTNKNTGNVSAIDVCPQSDLVNQEPPERWVNGRWCHMGFSPEFKVVKAIGLNTNGTARPLAMPSDIDITIDLTGTYLELQFRAYVAQPGDDTFSVLNVQAGTPDFQKSVFVCDRNDPNVLNPEACPKAGDKGTKGSLMYPDEDFYYLVNFGSNSIAVIDSDPDSLGGQGGVIQYNHEVGRVSRGVGMPCPGEPLDQAPQVEWCGSPLGIDNTPRIPYAYVMNSGSNTVSVTGASPQIQEPPDDHPVLHTINLGWSPTWVTLNRNQDFIFVSDPGPYTASDDGMPTGRVHVINTVGQREVGYTTQNIGTPLRIATPPDGWSAYVASSDGYVYAVDTVDRSGPGGSGDPFTSGGANDVTFPIPGTPGFHPMQLRLRSCPRANPEPPCAGQVDGGGDGNPTSIIDTNKVYLPIVAINRGTATATTTTITSDNPDPSVAGQPVTVLYSVVATPPGSGTPTGNVTVREGTNSCTGTVAAGSCSLTITTQGARTLTATYTGDANFYGSSGTASHTVNAGPTSSTRYRFCVVEGPGGVCDANAGLGGMDFHPDTFVGVIAVKKTSEVVAFDAHYDHFSVENPDGDTWNTVLTRIPIPLPPGDGPVAVAFTHDGTRALVLNSNGTVRIVQVTTSPTGEGLVFNLLPGIIQVGSNPVAVAFNEDDAYAYVVNSGSNTVSTINLSAPFGSDSVTMIPVGKNPQDIFINLGERVGAYVTNKGDGTVSIIDVLIDSPAFNTVVETVQLVNVTDCNPAVAVCPPEKAPVGLILTEP